MLSSLFKILAVTCEVMIVFIHPTAWKLDTNLSIIMYLTDSPYFSLPDDLPVEGETLSHLITENLFIKLLNGSYQITFSPIAAAIVSKSAFTPCHLILDLIFFN